MIIVCESEWVIERFLNTTTHIGKISKFIKTLRRACTKFKTRSIDDLYFRWLFCYLKDALPSTNYFTLIIIDGGPFGVGAIYGSTLGQEQETYKPNPITIWVKCIHVVVVRVKHAIFGRLAINLRCVQMIDKFKFESVAAVRFWW